MKNTMIDRHYYVRSDQDEKLKSLALRLQMKPAQLVRQGIDLVLKKHAGSENWLEETRKIRGLLRDDTEINAKLSQARESLNRKIDFTAR